MTTIHVDLNLAKEVVGDNDKLHALAFCVQIKGMYRSGRLHLRTKDETYLRRLMKLFGVGYYTITKWIKDATEYGYVRKDGDYLVANKIRFGRDRTFKMKFAKDFDFAKNHSDVVDAIRSAHLCNHIHKNEETYNTHLKASGKVKASNKAFKNARALATKYGVREATGRISYIRIAAILNVTRNKAIKLVQNLVNNGILGKSYYFQEIDWYAPNRYADKVITDLHGGYIVRKFDQVFIQLSNRFWLNQKGLFSNRVSI